MQWLPNQGSIEQQHVDRTCPMSGSLLSPAFTALMCWTICEPAVLPCNSGSLIVGAHNDYKGFGQVLQWTHQLSLLLPAGMT